LFRQHCIPAVYKAFRGLRALVADHDVCWISWPYFAFAALQQWLRAKIVVDYIDVCTNKQVSLIRQMPGGLHRFFTSLDTIKLSRYEKWIARKAWRVVVCKDEDGRFLRQPRKTFVVPNGTEPRANLPTEDADPQQLLFVGLMSYWPNADAASWFIRECLPLFDDARAKLDVVGGDPPEPLRKLDDGDRVRIRGFVPDLTEYYRRAAVVLAPIRLGSGTKLKVIEALAYGKALVATSEAVRGLNLRPGVDFLAADTPAAMAAACRRLVNDVSLRKQLGRAGRQQVERYYTWDRIGEAAQRAVMP
jgi:glycosyltransferase involved in cell wall biosynthesis